MVITLYFWALTDDLVQLPYFANVKVNLEREVLLLVTQLITGTADQGTQGYLQCSARPRNPVTHICIVKTLNSATSSGFIE